MGDQYLSLWLYASHLTVCEPKNVKGTNGEAGWGVGWGRRKLRRPFFLLGVVKLLNCLIRTSRVLNIYVKSNLSK